MTEAEIIEFFAERRKVGDFMSRGDECVSMAELFAFVRHARALERERCAVVCEEISDKYQHDESQKWPEMKTGAQTGASDCEYAIRALGD